jgi:hypothetical protein
MAGHQLPNDIDPYVIKGDKSSGLIYGIRDANIDLMEQETKKYKLTIFV